MVFPSRFLHSKDDQIEQIVYKGYVFRIKKMINGFIDYPVIHDLLIGHKMNGY